MGATGIYWEPLWAILEDEFDCLLVNARHLKQVPGRVADIAPVLAFLLSDASRFITSQIIAVDGGRQPVR